MEWMREIIFSFKEKLVRMSRNVWLSELSKEDMDIFINIREENS